MTAAHPLDALSTVADATAYFARWRRWSDEVRAHMLHARDLHYGPGSDETLDLLVPHTGAPLVVFFHGGYWRRLHKDDFTFVAGGLAPHGVATAIVNYSLAPSVTLETIVDQAQRAVAWLRANASEHGFDPSRIVVAGHSAGGQLAAMCAVDAPVYGLVTLCGLHDLRPLVDSFANAWLGLDQTRAAALSPGLLTPAEPIALYASAGESESAEFKEQGRDFAAAWRARGCEAIYADSPGDNHFTIVDRLRDDKDPLVLKVVQLALAHRRKTAKV